MPTASKPAQQLGCGMVSVSPALWHLPPCLFADHSAPQHKEPSHEHKTLQRAALVSMGLDERVAAAWARVVGLSTEPKRGCGNALSGARHFRHRYPACLGSYCLGQRRYYDISPRDRAPAADLAGARLRRVL